MSTSYARRQFGDMKRVVVAAFGWPVNRQEDAVYPYTEVDNTGERLDGASNYTLTFPKGLTRPTDGFWSGAAIRTAGTIPIRLANDEKRLAGALFIGPALRHVEDAIPAPTSKRSRSG